MLPALTLTAVLSAQRNAVAQAPAAPTVAQSVEPNDQRHPAGHVVNGERRIELDVVKITWQPDAPKGPTDTTAAFAERGHVPQMLGPLMRLTVGTPVHVFVRNTLDQPVHLRGLSDRTLGDPVKNGASEFMRPDPLVLASGCGCGSVPAHCQLEARRSEPLAYFPIITTVNEPGIAGACPPRPPAGTGGAAPRSTLIT